MYEGLILIAMNSVQVNIPAESGEMGVLASHVPSIEQLKPGLVEVIEEAGGSKQFFCMSRICTCTYPPTLRNRRAEYGDCNPFSLTALPHAVSGGFATVQPGSVMSINAVEGYPLEDFSADVRPHHTQPRRMRPMKLTRNH